MVDAAAVHWYKILELDELPERRVKTVVAGSLSFAITHFEGTYAALDNRCPHQGGPLGEGSIEIGNDGQCWLRCPWHGWHFDVRTGQSWGDPERVYTRPYNVEVSPGQQLVEGPYKAETFDVSVEENYLVIED